MTSDRIRCPSCLDADVAVMKLDKHGRPYIRCSSCNTTSFHPSPRSLTCALIGAEMYVKHLHATGSSVRDAQDEAAEMFRLLRAGVT